MKEIAIDENVETGKGRLDCPHAPETALERKKRDFAETLGMRDKIAEIVPLRRADRAVNSPFGKEAIEGHRRMIFLDSALPFHQRQEFEEIGRPGRVFRKPAFGRDVRELRSRDAPELFVEDFVIGIDSIDTSESGPHPGARDAKARMKEDHLRPSLVFARRAKRRSRRPLCPGRARLYACLCEAK